LFSVLGALSGALSTGLSPRARNQDQAAFVESPARPATASNPFLPDMTFQISPSRRLIQKIWDFPSICALASLMCFAAQVWLYICIYEPCSIQVVGGFAAAAALVALRRLRTYLVLSRRRASNHDSIYSVQYIKLPRIVHLALAHG